MEHPHSSGQVLDRLKTAISLAQTFADELAEASEYDPSVFEMLDAIQRMECVYQDVIGRDQEIH